MSSLLTCLCFRRLLSSLHHCFKRSEEIGSVALENTPDYQLFQNEGYQVSENKKNIFPDSEVGEVIDTREQRPEDRAFVRFSETLGMGAYGWVVKGSKEGGKQVIVKILKDDATLEELEMFRKEHEAWAAVQHDNVVRVLSGFFETFPLLSLVEAGEHYCAKQFLADRRTSSDESLTIQLCIDAVHGLSALNDHGLIHDDLALRSCILDSKLTLKLSNYGLGKSWYPEDYSNIINSDGIPLRWSSPNQMHLEESERSPVSFSKSSLADNIWTLGVLLWEILSWAGQPYQGLSDREVLDLLLNNSNVRSYFKISARTSLRLKCVLALSHKCFETRENYSHFLKRLIEQLEDVSRSADEDLMQVFRERTTEDNFTEILIS